MLNRWVVTFWWSCIGKGPRWTGLPVSWVYLYCVCVCLLGDPYWICFIEKTMKIINVGSFSLITNLSDSLFLLSGRPFIHSLLLSHLLYIIVHTFLKLIYIIIQGWSGLIQFRTQRLCQPKRNSWTARPGKRPDGPDRLQWHWGLAVSHQWPCPAPAPAPVSTAQLHGTGCRSLVAWHYMILLLRVLAYWR